MSRARQGWGASRASAWLYVLLGAGALVMAIPFAWMLLGAFKPDAELLRGTPSLLPERWTLDNFARLLSEQHFGRYLLNSAGIATVVTLANLLFCSMVGYALAKLRFAGSRLLLTLVLATLMLPGSVILIPQFVLMSKLGLVNTYAAVTVPFFAGAFGVFLMRQFTLSIPDELLGAARTDGAGEWTIFVRIVLPMMRPALAVVGLFQFAATWNSFLWPLVVLTDQAKYTLPVALASAAGGPYETDYGLLMAGSVLLVAPIVGVFLLSQRRVADAIAIGGRQRSVRPVQRSSLTGWAFGAPFLVLFSVFTLLPMLATVALSFTAFSFANLQDLTSAPFVGGENFARLVGDPAFLKALRNTAYLTVVGVPCTVGLGLAMALAVERTVGRMRSTLRLTFYLPVMTSIVAVAITWRYLLDPGTGLVNAGLARLGVDGPDWLGAPATTMPSIIALTVWRNAGESMVIFLAAFRTLDPDLDRAARMDGARAWQRFRFVTWPSLRPAILFCCIVTSIAYLHVFDEPYVMTGPNGGPGQAGLTASMFVYQQGFRFFDLGYASAAACTLFASVAVLTVAQLRLLRSRASA